MKTIFEITEWRDAAYSTFSEDGHGSYMTTRTIEVDVESMIGLTLDCYLITDEDHTLYFGSDDIRYVDDYAIVSNCVNTFNSYKDYKWEDCDVEMDDDENYYIHDIDETDNINFGC